MKSNKGSLILRALSADTDQAQLIAFLSKRAKNILPENIPDLLRRLPVVLSNNVSQQAGILIAAQLKQLGAEALFLPVQSAEAIAQAAESHRAAPADAAMPKKAKTRLNPDASLYAARLQSMTTTARLLKAGKELLVILFALAGAWALNYTIASQYLLLSIHTIPTVIAGYFLGLRQAVITAVASIVLVAAASSRVSDISMQLGPAGSGDGSHWYSVVSWGSTLLVIAFAIGTLQASETAGMQELRKTYHGLLLILKQCFLQDTEEKNHRFRVSVYAAKIAVSLKLDTDQVEDIRAAALLHDLGKLRISRSVLHKAARLSANEQMCIERYLADGLGATACSEDRLDRVLPVLVCLGDKLDKGNPLPFVQSIIPLGTKILSLADAYDALTNPSPLHTALSPLEARENIIECSGLDFDPVVVEAFVNAFNRGEMEIPGVIL